MRVLLDTHALLWSFTDDDRLPPYARNAIANPDNDVFVSVVALWEIVIKTSVGKLTLDEPFEELFPSRLTDERIQVLSIEIPHLATLRRLPLHHRDPFDRLMIAQALNEGIPIATRDSAFEDYGVDIVWKQS